MFPYIREYQVQDMVRMMKNSYAAHHRSYTALHGKTAVITGATSGVGRAAAENLAQYGCSLVVVARDESKATSLAAYLRSTYRCTVRVFLADFFSLKQVRRVAKQIQDRVEHLDILINSAGIYSTRKVYTDEGLESALCVNHLASFILTYELIPKLKLQPSARIIHINSQGHRFNGLNRDDLNWKRRLYTGLRGYGASKSAQLLTTWEFADRLGKTSVTIVAMHPGAVQSNIGRNNGSIYRWYHDNVLQHVLKDVRISGESIHYLAADEKVAEISGRYFNLTHLEKPSPHALDRSVGAKIWDISREITGMQNEL